MEMEIVVFLIAFPAGFVTGYALRLAQVWALKSKIRFYEAYIRERLQDTLLPIENGSPCPRL